jgi:hypothetical protein
VKKQPLDYRSSGVDNVGEESALKAIGDRVRIAAVNSMTDAGPARPAIVARVIPWQ